jgi:opacity protein-like surface antigen
MRFWTAIAACLLVALPAAASAAEPPVPHVYAAPTVGIWSWDKESVQGLDLVDGSALVVGGRVGYTPITAFSGELVVLAGSNDVKLPEGGTAAVHLTQAELSFLVNFRALLDTPVFPFLDLGAGVSFRRGDAVVDGEDVLDHDQVSFHLGGGLKADLTPRVGLRLNVRDTFFTETQGKTGRSEQVTVDAVELSLSLEYRIGLKNGRGPQRLR